MLQNSKSKQHIFKKKLIRKTVVLFPISQSCFTFYMSSILLCHIFFFNSQITIFFKSCFCSTFNHSSCKQRVLNKNRMLSCDSNTSTNVRHWYQRLFRNLETVNNTKRRPVFPLTAAHVTTVTQRMGGGALKAKIHNSLVCCTMILAKGGLGLSFVINYFILSAAHPVFYSSVLLYKNTAADTQTTTAFIHSVTNRESAQTVGSLRQNAFKMKHSSRSVSTQTSPLAEVGHVVKVPETLLVFAGEHAGLSWRCERRRLGGELLIKVANIFFTGD